MAKLSMGLFLLRVVQVRWHKVALWSAVGITTTTSVVLTVMLWTQTTPTRLSWDPLRTVGRWNFQIQPLSVGLGGRILSLNSCIMMKILILVFSLVQPLRFLFRNLSLAVHLVVENASARKDDARQRHELGCYVSPHPQPSLFHTSKPNALIVQEHVALQEPSCYHD